MTSSLCPSIYYILPLDNTQALTNTNPSQKTYDSNNLATHCNDAPEYAMTLAFEDFFMWENMLMKGFVNHADL
jgi:hypothetical protein